MVGLKMGLYCNSQILSLITTYTVVITQFALEAGTTNKLTTLCSSHIHLSENGTAVSGMYSAAYSTKD